MQGANHHVAVPKNSDPVSQDPPDDRQDHVLPGPVIGIPPANDDAIGLSGSRDGAILLCPGDVSHRHGADADIELDGHPDRHGGVTKPAATPGAVVRRPLPFKSSNKKPSRAGWFFVSDHPDRQPDGRDIFQRFLTWGTHLFVVTSKHTTRRVSVVCPILSGFLEAQCVMTDKASRWWLARKGG